MAQWLKMLVTESGNLRDSPWTHVVEGEKRLLKVVLGAPHICCVHVRGATYMHTWMTFFKSNFKESHRGKPAPIPGGSQGHFYAIVRVSEPQQSRVRDLVKNVAKSYHTHTAGKGLHGYV